MSFPPSKNRTSSLMTVIGVFAVGFLMRPAGSVIFGIPGGDRLGRKKTPHP